ncbi:MAG TPA: hypothetical protein VGI12_16235 [Vicinamibacterales bacterium]|jgi:hypothetical protein
MTAVFRSVCIALAALTVGCGGSKPAAPSTDQPPSTGGGTTITGTERLGWTETGDGANGFVYAAYVDGVRNELTQATCTSSSSGAFACESPLPPLTKGTHTLQLSAAVRNGDSLIEGPKSDSIVVTVTGPGTAQAVAMAVPPERPATSSPSPAQDSGASPSCGLAQWDPTRLVAWSTAGDLELVSPNRRAVQALTWSSQTDSSWHLAAVAARTEPGAHVVYVALTSLGDAEPRVRIVRYRELNGVLGERAVLVEGALPSRPAGATASFGPDGRLYVAFGWATAAPVAGPFVAVVDPGTPGPLDLDAGFVARFPIAATWNRDGQFWIVERSGSSQYAVRSTATGGAIFTSTATVIGVAALETTQLAVFADDGTGWLMSPAGPRASPTLRAARVLTDNPAHFGAINVSGRTAVGCSLRPQLTFTYAAWHD